MKTITEAEYRKASNDHMGWCTTCNAFTRENTEPDAEGYACPDCDGRDVTGAENALLAGLISFELDDVESPPPKPVRKPSKRGRERDGLTTEQRLTRIRPAWKGATLVRVERVSGSEWVPESAEERHWRECRGYSRPQRKAVFDAVRVEHPSGAVAHIKWDGVFNVVPGTVL